VKSSELHKISEILKTSESVAVRLYDNLKIYLVEDFPEKQVFKAKFLPCAENARDYEIRYSEVKEIIDVS